MPEKDVRKPTVGRSPISGAEAAGVGFQFAVTLVLFAFAGIWLDERLGTSPWLVIVMVLAGGGLAFYALYRRLMAPRAGAPDRKGGVK